MSSRLTLITHAATAAQRQAAFPLDEPVLDTVAARLSGMQWSASNSARAWCGPELRTRETARLLGLDASVSNSLQDCGYGQWRGQTMETVQLENPEGVVAWLTQPEASPHGGESILQLLERVGRWMSAQSSVHHTLAVTHPAVVRAALVHALQLPAQSFWRFDIGPLTLTDLRLNGAVWTVRNVGCALSCEKDD